MSQDPAALQTIEPGAASADFVARWFRHPDWATGFISTEDARFLFEMLAETRPDRIIEIGVASGVSTAFLLRAIEGLGLPTRLHSFDVVPYYYADPTRAVGQFVLDTFGAWPPALTLSPGVPSMAAAERYRRSGAGRARLAFIDANHDHPWPCLDLLALLPVLAPAGWVALHDVNLPLIAPRFSSFGSHHLFHRWPGARCVLTAGTQLANTGAIRLFEDPQATVDAVLDILEQPWDRPVHEVHCRTVLRELGRLGGGRAGRLSRILRANRPAGWRGWPVADRLAGWLGRRWRAIRSG